MSDLHQEPPNPAEHCSTYRRLVFTRGCSPCDADAWERQGPELPDSFEEIYLQGVKSLKRDLDKDAESVGGGLPWYAKFAIAIVGVGFTTFLALLAPLTRFMATIVPTPMACDTERFRKSMSRHVLFEWLGEKLSIFPKQMYKLNEYESNYTCPTEITSPDGIIRAQLRGIITDKQAEFGTRMHGVCPGWHEVELQSQKTTLSISEIMRLWNCGQIKSADLGKWLRRQGVLDNDLVEAYKFLYEVVPPLGTVISWAQRDLLNDQLAEELGLDDGFNERMRGQLGIWAKRSGVTERTLRLMYRAQADIPNKAEVRKLLTAGDIDRDKAVLYVRGSGFSKSHAEQFVDAILTINGPSIAAKQGMPTLGELEAAYIGDVLTAQEFESWLHRVNVPAEFIQNYFDSADFRRVAKRKHDAIQSVRSAFRAGRISGDDLPSKLIDTGMDVAAVQETADEWIRLRVTTEKEIAVGELCKLYGQSLISADDYFIRMTELGYSGEASMLKIQSCAQEWAEKRAKEKESAERKALAATEKAANKIKAHQRELNKQYKEMFPCKPAPKPVCKDGIEPPQVAVNN